MDLRRRARKRGRANDDGPLLTERDQAEIDAIRRQLDAEYGEFGVPGAPEGEDRTAEEGARPDRARRRLVLLVLCIGSVAGAAATAGYLIRTSPQNVAEPRNVAQSSDSAATPAPRGTDRPDTGSLPASPDAPDRAAAPPAPLPKSPPRPEAVTPSSPSEPARGGDGSPAARPELPPRESRRAAAPRSDQIMTVDPPSPPRVAAPTTDGGAPTLPRRPAPPAAGPSVEESTPASPSTSPAPVMPERPAAALLPRPPTPPTGARTGARPGMTLYADPQGRFRIEYPTGWQVRPPAAAGSTAFYLDDPDEGIAVTVQAQGTVSGRVEASALTPVALSQLKQRYPDLTLVVTSSQLLAGGAEQSRFTARWTNRWAQRMRATGRIVSVTRDGHTAYVYAAGQAQELVFPALEPILLHMLDSFSDIPKG